jgi:hypothetical protein
LVLPVSAATNPVSRTLLLRVEVPIRTVSEANQREHWALRLQRKHAQQIAVATLLDNVYANTVAAQDVPLDVHLTRCASRALDSDNLVGSMKHVRDAIAQWIGIDDGDPRVSYQVGQRIAAKPKMRKIFERNGKMRRAAEQKVVIEIYRRSE